MNNIYNPLPLKKQRFKQIIPKLHSKDNEAARRRFRRRISNTLRKPTTMPTKLAEEGDLVSAEKQMGSS